MNKSMRSDNERLGDISYQLARVADEMRAFREYLVANGQYIVSEDEFNANVAHKLTKDE